MNTFPVHLLCGYALFLACSQAPTDAFAQVTYFTAPPTTQQVEDALRINAEPKPDAALTERGIQWRDTGVAPPRQPGGLELAATLAPAVAIPVNFEPGSSQIKRTSMSYVGAIASALAHNPLLQLNIEGHSDASGDARKNLMLSWERAFSVFKVLVVHYGIDPVRLRPIGKGDTEPLQGAVPTESINRRVQFRVMGGAAG